MSTSLCRVAIDAEGVVFGITNCTPASAAAVRATASSGCGTSTAPGFSCSTAAARQLVVALDADGGALYTSNATSAPSACLRATAVRSVKPVLDSVAVVAQIVGALRRYHIACAQRGTEPEASSQGVSPRTAACAWDADVQATAAAWCRAASMRVDPVIPGVRLRSWEEEGRGEMADADGVYIRAGADGVAGSGGANSTLAHTLSLMRVRSELDSALPALPSRPLHKAWHAYMTTEFLLLVISGGGGGTAFQGYVWTPGGGSIQPFTISADDFMDLHAVQPDEAAASDWLPAVRALLLQARLAAASDAGEDAQAALHTCPPAAPHFFRCTAIPAHLYDGALRRAASAATELRRSGAAASRAVMTTSPTPPLLPACPEPSLVLPYTRTTMCVPASMRAALAGVPLEQRVPPLQPADGGVCAHVHLSTVPSDDCASETRSSWVGSLVSPPSASATQLYPARSQSAVPTHTPHAWRAMSTPETSAAVSGVSGAARPGRHDASTSDVWATPLSVASAHAPLMDGAFLSRASVARMLSYTPAQVPAATPCPASRMQALGLHALSENQRFLSRLDATLAA